MTAHALLPLRRIEDGLVISQRDVWAYYRIPVVSYELLSEGDRLALLSQITGALSALRSADIHLVIAPRRVDPAQWIATSYSQAGSAASSYLREVASHMEQRADLWLREVYLGVRLGTRKGSREGPLRASLAAFERILGVDDVRVSDREVARWRSAATETSRILEVGALRARPATRAELAHLVQRAFWRGLEDRQPPLSAAASGPIAALAEGVIHNARGHLEIEQPAGRSHVAFLGVARFPDELPFPGGEWLLHSAVTQFPVEVSLRGQIVPPVQAIRDTRRRLSAAIDQARHIEQTETDVPLALAETTREAKELEHALTREATPLLYATTVLAVAASTSATLEQRITDVIERYRDLSIDVVRPTGDQLTRFCEALPGDRIRERAYHQTHALDTLAGSAFWAGGDLGDGTGPYIGTTTGRTRSAVHFDPLAAARRNLPGTLSITGAPGGGKTVLAQLLAYQAALLGQASVLFVDPKNEAAGLEALSELGSVHRLRLGAAHAGQLDPYFVAEDAEHGAVLAYDIARLLVPQLTPSQDSLLLRTSIDVAQGATPCLLEVVGAVEPHDADLAESLQALAGFPLASLFFGSPDTDRGIVDPTNALTILNIESLALGGTESGGVTLTDQISRVVVMLLTALAHRLAFTIPKQFPKLVVVDEAWAITSHPAGARFIERLARTGRSNNTALVLVTQNAADLLDSAVRNNLSAKFAFQSTDDGEIASVLKLLGIPETTHEARLIRSLRNGECVFADVDGRRGTVGIDLVRSDLLAAFDSTPVTRSQEVA